MAGLRAICFLLILSVASGCAPAVVGGGAAGAYKVGTEERTAGVILDDAAITARVKAALAREESVKARNIDVDTVEGVVVLIGLVDSNRELDRAAEIARAEAGVVHVRNELRVGTRTVGQTIDDKALGATIKTKLFQEPGIRALNVDVDVYLGTVYLGGVVTPEQQAKVIAIVHGEPGVKDIVNNLRIR